MNARLSAARPLTYFITDGSLTQENFPRNLAGTLEIVRSAVKAGITMVQIREKALTGKQLFHLAAEAAAVTRGTETKLLINDRADIAAASGADGVHLSGKSLPADAVRRSFGDGILIGVSTHSLAEVQNAAEAGADFVVFGPVFETPGKGEPKGVDELRSVCRRMGGFSVLALGGVDEANVQRVMAAGAAGYAAIRSFYQKLAG